MPAHILNTIRLHAVASYAESQALSYTSVTVLVMKVKKSFALIPVTTPSLKRADLLCGNCKLLFFF